MYNSRSISSLHLLIGLAPKRILVLVCLFQVLTLTTYGQQAAQAEADKKLAGAVLEDIRSSHTTLLEPTMGQLGKVRLGVKVFLDADDVLANLPVELQGRSFIRSNKSGVKAICRKAGYVYAVTASPSPQAKLLVEKGFRQLDFGEFQLLNNDASKAVAYQKPVAAGETLDFSPWVLLIFGPEERGGVAYSKMRSLSPPAFMPDGSEFKTWEVPLKFSKTLYVDQSHPQASDANPGTKEKPFKTINRAAQLLEPGERVVVAAGVYREWVRPERGGTDPEHMISYEAAPGAKVVIKGSELLRVKWMKSTPWIRDHRIEKTEATVKEVWMARFPPELFAGYNPFAIDNYRQANQMIHWNMSQLFSDRRSRFFTQVRGLVFQNGRRLNQTTRYTELFTNEGAFWVEPHGLTIHIATYGGVDPNQAEWEVTAREQIFASENYHLGYIRVKGFTMENAANGFPFPQRGAISTMHGHHWLIEDNTIQWVNGVGIDIGDGGEPPATPPELLGYDVIRRNTLNDIGVTGITGPGPYGTLIEDNVFRRNVWHDVEHLAECAAIKTHHNLNVLVRRNLIFDTLHGTAIWLDSNNSNSRITQNVVVGTGTNNGPGPGHGGIYVEAALAPNMVDNNFVWGSTQTNGIYNFFISKLIVAHNLVGNSAAAGMMIRDVGGRAGGNRTIPSGNNRVFANIFINNGWNLGFYEPNNFSDYNLYGQARQANPFQMIGKKEELSLSDWRKNYGLDLHSSEADITATFNADTLELVWAVRGAKPVGGDFVDGLPAEGMAHDFWNRPRVGPKTSPGPFGSIPSETTRIVVDPRLPRK